MYITFPLYVADNPVAVKTRSENVRVLCWILTTADNFHTKTVHVNNTWARRCTKYFFFASHGDYSFDVPILYMKIPEGRQHLTKKSMIAFRFLYRKYIDEFDWFLKADDDTYVIVENLQYFLQDKDPNEPVFFGHHFLRPWGAKSNVFTSGHGYFSGGAGYVLSRESLRRFGEKGEDPYLCKQDGLIEDYDMSRCLQNLGVSLGKSLDSHGRNRFNCFSLENHLAGPVPDWYKAIDANGGRSVSSFDTFSVHIVVSYFGRKSAASKESDPVMFAKKHAKPCFINIVLILGQVSVVPLIFTKNYSRMREDYLLCKNLISIN